MQNQIFRLFVSSPFSDFKKERDVLHKKVFPKIDKYCNENGFSFQPIDLRWGVSDEAQLDQKTLEVCLEEVRACKHFPHPNFLIMAGDRYGYIPLSYMIEKAEFDKIKEIYENDKEKISINYEVIKDEKGEVLSQKAPKKLEKLELLDEWYKLDENQIPISYILKPRTDEHKEYPNWQIDQEYLRTILQYAANMLFENKEDKEYQKYFTSATEAEVLEGILEYKYITHTQEKLLENKIVENSKLDKEYVYGYIRTIQNPTGKYIDSIKDKEKEEFLKQKAIDFKTNLSNTLDLDKNILTSAYDSIELYEENQLKEFEEFIYEKLIKAIETQKNKSNEISHIQIEIIEQEKFKNDKQKGFIGRKNTLDKIENYVLNDKTNEPLVIYGISGMGKSSLIAKAIDNVSKLIDKESLIYRFVGATQNSTIIRSLLISICDELANKNIIEKIEKYEFKEYKFFKQINETLSNIKKSIVLFIDALDQLQFKDSLQWLPKNLPENFKIILSVLNDEKYEKDSHYYNFLKNKVDSNNLIDISKDSLGSSKEDLVKNLLSDLNRKIDDYQTKYLLNKWKETNYSPLYLKIAIEEVKHWKSGDTSQILESNVEGIVKEYIKNLTKIYHHEEIFVNKVFGYIHASKDGLSEKELLEILSEDLEDEILMKDKIINEYHEPIKVRNPRRENKEELILPMSIWSRLHTQIKPFIIQRNIDNQPLMKFFHRQFTSVISSCFENDKFLYHKKLVDYFTADNYSARSVLELPYALFQIKDKKIIDLYKDLNYLISVYKNQKEKFFYEQIEDFKVINNFFMNKFSNFIFTYSEYFESNYFNIYHIVHSTNTDLFKNSTEIFKNKLLIKSTFFEKLDCIEKVFIDNINIDQNSKFLLKNNVLFIGNDRIKLKSLRKNIANYDNTLINIYSQTRTFSHWKEEYDLTEKVLKIELSSKENRSFEIEYMSYINFKSNENKTFIIFLVENGLHIFDTINQKFVDFLVEEYIKYYEIIENDLIVVTNKVLKLYHLDKLKKVNNLDISFNNIQYQGLNNFDKILAYTNENIYVYDVNDNSLEKNYQIKDLKQAGISIQRLTFSKDYNFVIIVFMDSYSDNLYYTEIHDLNTSKCLYKFEHYSVKFDSENDSIIEDAGFRFISYPLPHYENIFEEKYKILTIKNNKVLISDNQSLITEVGIFSNIQFAFIKNNKLILIDTKNNYNYFYIENYIS